MSLTSSLKLSLIPRLLSLGASAGMKWPAIIERSGRFQREALIGQIRDLFSRPCEAEERAGEKLDILFMPYIGCFQGNNMIQIMLGRVLAARGHRVRFLICDVELPLCETTDIATHPRREEICTYNHRHLDRFLAATGMDVVRVSEILSDTDVEVEQPGSGRWGTFVESMLLRYFKVGQLNSELPKFTELHRRAEEAAELSEAVGRAIVAMNPDRVLMSHGTYTTRGPARVIINEAEIPLLTISRAKIAHSQKFNWKTSGDWWDLDRVWKEESELELTESQHALIDDYLQSRRNHQRDVMVYNFSDEESRERTLQKLGVEESSGRIYTLFTNVLWDAASAQREVVFANALAWVKETVAWFGDNPEQTLIVRIHPAESVIGTQQPMQSLIDEAFPELPSNVIVLAPDAPFNSWSLLSVTDVGLVHTSTVGLELALEGIPCVCVSKTHYRDKGFTVDVPDRQAYDTVLRDGLPGHDSERTRLLAKRYAYLLFLRYQIPLRYFLPRSHIAIRAFSFESWSEIVDAPEIRLIVEGIECQKESFVMSHELASQMCETTG